MPASVITIAQAKGGAGKSSLAAHLAAACAGSGHSVLCLDLDPQASLAAWCGRRDGVPALAGTIAHEAMSGWRIGQRVSAAARDHDLVLIDTPAHGDLEAREAIRAADLVLIPVQPSPLDVQASTTTVRRVSDARTGALVVLNRVPARATLTRDLQAELAALGVPIAHARIGNRIAIASALVDGRGVTEAAPRSQAAAEIRALAQEVLGAVRKPA